ncbi:hypothetical protein HK105_204349 [Polyrhizophydium stewartii]|uniref:Uncharacterized protein n=1 Tax=Polyrhizophydium stewartii TaxID=2732419 RepID=A0ABR4N9P9_9FUNG
MGRTPSAHLAPSAVIIGVAFSELASAAQFMLCMRREVIGSAICILSLVAFVVVLAMASVEISLVDFLVSPYMPWTDSPLAWQAKMTIAAFALNTLATALVLLLFVARLRIFHRSDSSLLWILSFMAAGTFLFAAPANVINIICNIEVVQGRIKIFSQSSLIGLSNALFAATHTLEGIFSAACSATFLWEIGKALGFSKKEFALEILRRREGIRFIAILALNILISAFTLHAYVFGFTYITYVVYYLPVLIYSIEIHTFLIASYEAPREFISNRLGQLIAVTRASDRALVPSSGSSRLSCPGRARSSERNPFRNRNSQSPLEVA